MIFLKVNLDRKNRSHALVPLSRRSHTSTHPLIDSPALLRRLRQAHGIREQVFQHLNAFDVGSLRDAARLKSSIRLVERARFLHPLRSLFIDTELYSLEGTTCSETPSSRHQSEWIVNCQY
jgi:hypothetical protein